MYNTYLNEFMSVPYPFLGGSELPFPNCIFTHASICVLRDKASTDAIYISYISISATRVSVVIACGSEVIGTGTGDHTASEYIPITGISESAGTHILGGVITIGNIPSRAYGVYLGDFRLDPSCILQANSDDPGMPANMYSRYGDTIYINEYKHTLAQNVHISGQGMATISGGLVHIDELSKLPDFDCMQKYTLSINNPIGLSGQWTDLYEYVRSAGTDNSSSSGLYITSINNSFDIASTANMHEDKILYINSEDPAISINSTIYGSVCEVSIQGGVDFPNCYAKDMDSADKSDGELLNV